MKLPSPLSFVPWGTLVLLGSFACRGAPPSETGDPDLSVAVGISPTPPVVGPARILLTLTDSQGRGVPGASIRVEGNMNHAGMVPVVDTAVEEGEGRYAVPAFRFSMAGDWILTVRASLPDGRWKEVQHTTRVMAAGGGG